MPELSTIECVKCGRDTALCLEDPGWDCYRGDDCLCDDEDACYGHCPGCLDRIDYCLTAGNCLGEEKEE